MSLTLDSMRPRSVEEAVEKIREEFHCVGDFEDLTTRIGMWLDIDDAYWTMSNEFVESVWWLFAQMWGNGDIEEGLRAASAVGDDAIQKRTQGYVVPDAFTHGRAEQRMRWSYHHSRWVFVESLAPRNRPLRREGPG